MLCASAFPDVMGWAEPNTEVVVGLATSLELILPFLAFLFVCLVWFWFFIFIFLTPYETLISFHIHRYKSHTGSMYLKWVYWRCSTTCLQCSATMTWHCLGNGDSLAFPWEYRTLALMTITLASEPQEQPYSGTRKHWGYSGIFNNHSALI